MYHHHLPPVGAAKISESGQCSYVYGSYVVVSGLLFLSGGGGGGGATISSYWFSKYWQKTQLFASQSPARWFSQTAGRMSPPSSDIVASLNLNPLFHWCLPVLSDVSSQMSILPGSLYNTVPDLFPSPLFDHQPFMTTFLTPCRNDIADHASAGGSQLLLGPHHCPWSVPSVSHGVLRLDAGPHATSLVLWQVALQPLL
jgi:hypothetical protein